MPTEIYATSFESLCITKTGGGFDMRSQRNIGKEKIGATNTQYIAPTEQNSFAHLLAYDLEHTSHRTNDEDVYLNRDYEMPVGTKLGYVFFQSSRKLRASKIQLLRIQGQKERTQILTILMLSLDNPRFADYMLTRNWSVFLETAGNLASLFHFPLAHSPLHTMNQCYERIPILYENQIRFGDPITRPTHTAADLQKCTDWIKNLFQFGKEQKHSWYTLTPDIVHQDRPAVFWPKNVTPVAVYSSSGSQEAEMYSTIKLSSFWDKILISAASQKRWQQLVVFSNIKKTLTVLPHMLLELTSSLIIWSCMGNLKTNLRTPLEQFLIASNISESTF